MATSLPAGLMRGTKLPLVINPLGARYGTFWNARYKSTLSIPASKASKDGPQLPPHSLLPNKMLLRSLMVATVSSHPWLLSAALRVLSTLVHPKLSVLDVNKNPLLRRFIKTTFYNHFCAGENGAEVKSTIGNIKNMGFKGVILTYAREIVVDASNQSPSSPESAKEASNVPDPKETSKNADIEAWRDGVLETVRMVGEGDILALKLTGAGQPAMQALSAGQPLPAQMVTALREICDRAVEQKARIFIDAEQQSVQAGIDAIALDLMRQYNQGPAVVFNTYQAYLKSTPTNLLGHVELAEKERFTLGIKLVRGAYISSEPRGLINDTKADTDDSFNTTAEGIIRCQFGTFGSEKRPFPPVELFIATHNNESAMKADALITEQLSAGKTPPKVQYGQLLGMADGVSCRLLQLGMEDNTRQEPPEVFKCLSWGTIGDCLSYLMRRAVENRDAVGRTKEESLQLRQEVFRRIKRLFW
ncbi:hypothetical protein N7532_002758 [Penicillium argentinense]|uniref:Proline dehydrogenase n=1 Tax=Penicillium argentinense TaxID=1131581 RepID=A0A9W9KLR8_9EURO|nr:uncharacterized protein N7532_002758 [Penicillium argentinense]KAJ5110113.1 hypothetical protein N7532_002758 [Penicillium argentinense]